jgi:hypothetical protein
VSRAQSYRDGPVRTFQRVNSGVEALLLCSPMNVGNSKIHSSVSELYKGVIYQ